MSSHGIKDRVAIVGMGCTPFREHWDKGTDDLLIDAADRHVRVGGYHQGRRRRLLVRHRAVGHVRHHARRSAQARGQAGHPRRELLRHGLRGAPPGRLLGGIGGVRPGDGDRRREGEGLRLPGPQCLPDPQRRHQPHPHRRRDVLAGRCPPTPRSTASIPTSCVGWSPASRRRTTTTAPTTHAPSSVARWTSTRSAPCPPSPASCRSWIAPGWRTARPRRSCVGPRTPTSTPTTRCT